MHQKWHIKVAIWPFKWHFEEKSGKKMQYNLKSGTNPPPPPPSLAVVLSVPLYGPLAYKLNKTIDNFIRKRKIFPG